MSEVGDHTVKLLKEYAKHQDKLSDKRADKLLDEYFAVSADSFDCDSHADVM